MYCDVEERKVCSSFKHEYEVPGAGWLVKAIQLDGIERLKRTGAPLEYHYSIARTASVNYPSKQ